MIRRSPAALVVLREEDVVGHYVDLSVTVRPSRFSIPFMTLQPTASVTCCTDLPYSTTIERSMVLSTSPTSTEAPRVWLCVLAPGVRLPKKRPDRRRGVAR